jgi:hypothetical protein
MTVGYPRVRLSNNSLCSGRPRLPLKVLLVEAFCIIIDATINFLKDAIIYVELESIA